MCPPSASMHVDYVYDRLLLDLEPLLIGSNANKAKIKEHIYSALEDLRDRLKRQDQSCA